jgi:hypothetical protein
VHESPCPISVAFPVHRAPATLESAFACVSTQSAAHLDIMMVLNGSDGETRERVHALARQDPRVRVLDLPRANLAAALNLALREARHNLVARMDADDLCAPSRLELQARALLADASLAGVGCAYRVLTHDGRPRFVVRPPTDPGELRWRLLLGNMLAHGSMMLRRDAVLAVGGYDESVERAQDYDLWLRLVRQERLGARPEVLYDYRVSSAEGADRSSPEQADTAARCMLREWRLLADRDGTDRVERSIAAMLTRASVPEVVRGQLAEHLTTHGPTRESLFAWTWASAASPSAPTLALQAARRALVREATRVLADRGVARVWLYPAGAFTRSLLEHPEDFATPIAGLLDDRADAVTIGAWRAHLPSEVNTGEHILITSDWHEDALWDASNELRARGVRVHRLHALSVRDAHASPNGESGGRPLLASIEDPHPACPQIA